MIPSRSRRAPAGGGDAAGRRLSRSALVSALLALAGMLVFAYPSAASWVSQYNQSKVIEDYARAVDDAHPDAATQLALAHEYNAALSSGAVLEANGNVPVGVGGSGAELDYNSILDANGDGLMARLRIAAIDLDLPVYHGTSEETLLEGLGHLEGTSLPVGGTGTRAVITGHRGLATATMFTNLNKVAVGDVLTIEVFGQVLTYRVTQTKVVEPERTEELRAEPGRDLVTLVTCTPLGVNTHRILVTGERIPTPPRQAAAGQRPNVPRFPWWAVALAAGVMLDGVYLWRSGRPREPRAVTTRR
ncbi:class C sortase [Actinomyces qiguomingii]|uniref:class C sortase n=1 Tax=Actinomyces qiguomingii TaxID=2057800 RepID=UPI001E33B061|nr:class C sortase [Actinomyces qiguomingii]